MVIQEELYGFLPEPEDKSYEKVTKYILTNDNNVTVEIINYGATITSIKCPDGRGKLADIITGFDDLEGYLGPDNPFFGATVGRVANRIANATFELDGQTVKLSKNSNENHLHGGFVGFDKVIWTSYIDSDAKKVIMSYLSRDKEEGYPGNVVVNLSFELTACNELVMQFKAMTTKPTCVNLTNHCYFNLAGHDKGAPELYKHVFTINADSYVEANRELIPTGKIVPVKKTVFDLRVPKALGKVIKKVKNMPGFDHTFCINKQDGMNFVARVMHPKCGRILEVFSDQPGVHFYTGNGLPDLAVCCKANYIGPKICGKQNKFYGKHGSFCLESHIWPDAANHDNFPSPILRPGDIYAHNLIYKFDAKPVKEAPKKKCAKLAAKKSKSGKKKKK